MAAEIVPACCSEKKCQRQQSIRIERNAFGQWWALTQYAEVSKDGIGEVHQRHRLHPLDEQKLEDQFKAASEPIELQATGDVP